MKSNVILFIGSDMNMKKEILDKAHGIANYIYIKVEALLSAIAETLNRRMTEQETISFLNKYIEKIYDKEEIYILDINNCKEEILNYIISNKQLYVIRLEDNEDIKNNPLIELLINMKSEKRGE